VPVHSGDQLKVETGENQLHGVALRSSKDDAPHRIGALSGSSNFARRWCWQYSRRKGACFAPRSETGSSTTCPASVRSLNTKAASGLDEAITTSPVHKSDLEDWPKLRVFQGDDENSPGKIRVAASIVGIYDTLRDAQTTREKLFLGKRFSAPTL
jgi:hypothetical protein